MYLLQKVQIVYLKADKALIKVSSKFANFVNIFLSKLVIELSKYININNYAIKLVQN